MEDLTKIPFKELEGKFIKFFDLADNRQILFSGPFGSGKTTFLKDFTEIKSKEYEFIHIFPVNYSLHNNVDIYEILKYDIILELIGKGVFGAPQISSLMAYIFATTQTLDNALANLLSGFSKTGKQLKDLIDLLKKNKQNFAKKIQDIKDPLLGIRSIENLINEIKGYEYDDYITGLIREKLSDLSKGKKVVLIVDDLDRIDPEHLLRIISVFSAHIDYNTGENKFGFDKIIFVGDIESFKGMFIHRFGTAETFNGYITKLCSKQPFNFDPAQELYTKIISILSIYKANHKNETYSFFPFEQKSTVFKEFIVYLFANLI
ncbi:MAG: recombinase family protein, partial [Sphingobacteriales bacterium]